MKRVTLRIPENQVDELERHVDNGEFVNRSDAIRTAVRDMLGDMDDPGHQMWSKGRAD